MPAHAGGPPFGNPADLRDAYLRVLSRRRSPAPTTSPSDLDEPPHLSDEDVVAELDGWTEAGR